MFLNRNIIKIKRLNPPDRLPLKNYREDDVYGKSIRKDFMFVMSAAIIF